MSLFCGPWSIQFKGVKFSLNSLAELQFYMHIMDLFCCLCVPILTKMFYYNFNSKFCLFVQIHNIFVFYICILPVFVKAELVPKMEGRICYH